VAAISILAAITVGFLNNDFQTCNVETVSGSAPTTTKETCNRPTVTDAGVVAVTLLIALLLAPDMSEIGVFGIALKRRLEAAEAQAVKSEAKADKLETQLQLLRIETVAQAAASAQVSVHNDIGGFLRSEEGRELKVRDSALSQQVNSTAGSDGAQTSTPRTYAQDISDDRAQSAMKLISNWEILAASLNLPPHNRWERLEVPTLGISASEAAAFEADYAPDLSLVRKARNTVAHARPITDSDLQAAVDLSNLLLQILDDRYKSSWLER
jgi:hypothetical protein